MRKVLLCLLLLLPSLSCGKDNSSRVKVSVDGAGCLISVSDYDWTSETVNRNGVRTVNYRWECADYASPISGVRVENKRVTLTFVSTACMQLSSEIIGEGYCFTDKVPLF